MQTFIGSEKNGKCVVSVPDTPKPFVFRLSVGFFLAMALLTRFACVLFEKKGSEMEAKLKE